MKHKWMMGLILFFCITIVPLHSMGTTSIQLQLTIPQLNYRSLCLIATYGSIAGSCAAHFFNPEKPYTVHDFFAAFSAGVLTQQAVTKIHRFFNTDTFNHIVRYDMPEAASALNTLITFVQNNQETNGINPNDLETTKNTLQTLLDQQIEQTEPETQ